MKNRIYKYITYLVEKLGFKCRGKACLAQSRLHGVRENPFVPTKFQKQ